jgi:hypothetical protein
VKTIKKLTIIGTNLPQEEGCVIPNDAGAPKLHQLGPKFNLLDGCEVLV